MILRPPRSTRTYTLVPYAALLRARRWRGRPAGLRRGTGGRRFRRRCGWRAPTRCRRRRAWRGGWREAAAWTLRLLQERLQPRALRWTRRQGLAAEAAPS